MTGQRWWDVFVPGTLVVLAVVNAVAWSSGEGWKVASWAVLALYLACYLLFGRRSLSHQCGAQR